MKIHEITDTAEKYSKEFANAVYTWQAMEGKGEEVVTILASPEAQPFKTPPPGVQMIYRAVSRIRNVAARKKVIPYSTSIEGAIYFAETLQIHGRWHVIGKKFNPSDLLLDFTRMVKHYGLVDPYSYDDKENEVWMRNNPYYATLDKSEVVKSVTL